MHIISNNKNCNLKLTLTVSFGESGKKLIFIQFMVMKFLLDSISLIFSQSPDTG